MFAPPHLLNIDDVCARLKVGRKLGYKIMARAGAVRLGERGGALRIEASALDAWVASRRPPPSDPLQQLLASAAPRSGDA